MDEDRGKAMRVRMLGTKGGQMPTHLAGWTGRGRGLAPGGLQLLLLQLLLLVQLTHRLFVAALPPAPAWREPHHRAEPGPSPEPQPHPIQGHPVNKMGRAQGPRLNSTADVASP